MKNLDIISNFDYILWVKDKYSKFIYVNEELLYPHNIRKEDLLGKTQAEIELGEDLKSIKNFLEKPILNSDGETLATIAINESLM